LHLGNYSVIAVTSDLKIEQLVKEIIQQSKQQIILEVPENTPLLTNEINLRLIKFYAEDEAKELIINTVDPYLVALAQRLGISTIRERNLDVPALAETAAASTQNSSDSASVPVVAAKPKKRRKAYRWKHHGFLPAVVAALASLLIGLWFFFQPQVVVVVYPKEQKLNFGAKVITSPKYRDSDILMSKIPAKKVDKINEFQLETVTTGTKVIGVTPATGSVVLLNYSKQPVVIPKGTLVSSASNVKFRIVKNVLVPRKVTQFRYGIPVGEEYGKVEVTVRAVESGTRGNQPAKSITKLEGKLKNNIQVVNLKSTFNGTDRRVAVVAQADLNKGNDEAIRQMRLAAPDEMASLVGEDYLFFPELVEVKVLKLQSVPPLGSEATTVKTDLKYRATIVAPSRAGIHKYLSNQLDGHLPPNFAADNGAVKLVSAQVLSADSQAIRLHLVGTANLRGILSAEKIRALIKGKSIGEAKKLLTQQNEVADFKIETKDSRRSTIPRFNFQIKLLFPAGTNAR
jgi:hypothetical protein